MNKLEFIDKLSNDISKDVNNNTSDTLDEIYDEFNKTLNDSLKKFNTSIFDSNGFLKRIENINVGDKNNQDLLKNIINSMRVDYADVQSLNRSEILIKRDLENICSQMPEMRTVISIIRDAIVECNIATGELSRSYIFENNSSELNDSKILEIERAYDLLIAIKNYIIPRTLMTGETYILVVPYSKLFAEIDAIKNRLSYGTAATPQSAAKPSALKENHSIYSEQNLKIMMESVSQITKKDSADTYKVEKNSSSVPQASIDSMSKEYMKSILENIRVIDTSSLFVEEMGEDGFVKYFSEVYENIKSKSKPMAESELFNGITDQYQVNDGLVDEKKYQDIKGCYIKYLNGLQVVPIRMDRKIIGYYYITTSMDLAINPAQPSGIVDLSFQHYTKDKNLVENLTKIIIQAFDKKMLETNIKLKNEIAEIIMSHKFSQGRLSFVFIPETDIIRMAINEDENGRGHSVLEPTLFPARMYLMLTLYNMLYILNNNTTRVHYIKSSGLNKDYASQIQRVMRKFQSRRITIDDIYTYSGVLNKVGGMGEMVLPTGRGDYKALETDTIPAADMPLNTEFLEMQRKEAISGTGVPYTMITDAIESTDFAINVRMANARFLSTISGYKIDFNRCLTNLYQRLLKYNTDLDDTVIVSFKFSFNPARHQELAIDNELIQGFNGLVEMIQSVYYPNSELQDENGQPSLKQIKLRRKLAEKFLPQLDFESLEEIIKQVDTETASDKLIAKANSTEISEDNMELLNDEE